jgi:adenosylmethionine-8-amino-7-oxononanoate aminotransferase
MAAVELVADKKTKAAYPADFQAGVKVHTATQERGVFTRLRGDIYNIAPAFVIEQQQLEAIVERLGDSIEAVLGSE